MRSSAAPFSAWVDDDKGRRVTWWSPMAEPFWQRLNARTLAIRDRAEFERLLRAAIDRKTCPQPPTPELARAFAEIAAALAAVRREVLMLRRRW